MFELKCRAWANLADISNKEGHKMLWGPYDDGIVNTPGLLMFAEKYNWPVMLFIGRCDITGADIYEKDIIIGGLIVKHTSVPTRGFIGFDNENSSFANFNHGGTTLMHEVLNPKIIGNLFENPELYPDA